jgi:hypothetical protein
MDSQSALLLIPINAEHFFYVHECASDRCMGRLAARTDYGHPERAFFQKIETFGPGQTNWAENF